MAKNVRRARSSWPLLVGGLLVLHGLAHAAAAINTTTRITQLGNAQTATLVYNELWVSSILSAIAMSALTASGLGLLGIRAFQRLVWPLAVAGMTASLGLLVFFAPTATGTGILIGVAVLLLLNRRRTHTGLVAAPHTDSRRAFRRMAREFWITIVTVMAVLTLLRPIFLRWGTTPAETYAALPGDTERPGAGFQILHAVNIQAAPQQVWPWLAQIGHDRGGFYSYSRLENLFGLQIQNANRVVPEWQTRRVGELVPSTPPNWLGFVSHPLGWRVKQFEPGRVLVLENWGAFALVPVDGGVTRLYVRTQAPAGRKASLVWSPLEVLVF